MRLKLGLGVLFLVFLVAFSCTTKKPTKLEEVAIFRGRVVENSGQPAKYALVQLYRPIAANCTCKPGNIIECASLVYGANIQPTNAKGEYNMEIDWDVLGFLFDENSTCQMPFILEVSTQQVIQDTTFIPVIDTVFYYSLQDRSVPQVFDFQLP